MTVRELSNYHKISETSLHRLRRKGIDIQNPDAVARDILSRSRRPISWESGTPWKDDPEPTGDTGEVDETLPQDERDLRSQALAAKDYTEARFHYTRLRALKEAKQIEILDRNHVPAEEVKADMLRIGFGMRAAMLRLANDLAPILCGLNEVKIKRKIQDKTHILLTELSNPDSDLYRIEVE